MSTRRSIALAIACSGAMYSGVPVIMPVAVSPGAPSIIFASPKSAR